MGGATALTLLFHRPDLFGRVVAFASACYLLSTCGAQRAALVAQAKRNPAPVLLAVGEREAAANRAISEQLAPLLGVVVEVVPRVDHDWKAQLEVLGARVAAHHLEGFATSSSRP